MLTILIPAFNEERTVRRLLDLVLLAPYDKQIVVVDDGSCDRTRQSVEQWIDEQPSGVDVCLARHATNRGKGAAIRTGLALAQGEVTLIQDADLEYDPQDYPALVEPILAGRAPVVYGSRFLQPCSSRGRPVHRLCMALLNGAVWILYGCRITDEATCYKAFRTDLLKRLDLQCERFEFCPEVTAKLCRLGIPIHEVPIAYHARSAAEGKKIGWRDAVEAFWTLLWWRSAPVKLTGRSIEAAVYGRGLEKVAE